MMEPQRPQVIIVQRRDIILQCRDLIARHPPVPEPSTVKKPKYHSDHRVAIKHRKSFTRNCLCSRTCLRIMCTILGPSKCNELAREAAPLLLLMQQEGHNNNDFAAPIPSADDYYPLLLPLIPFLEQTVQKLIDTLQTQLQTEFRQESQLRSYLCWFTVELERFNAFVKEHQRYVKPPTIVSKDKIAGPSSPQPLFNHFLRYMSCFHDRSDHDTSDIEAKVLLRIAHLCTWYRPLSSSVLATAFSKKDFCATDARLDDDIADEVASRQASQLFSDERAYVRRVRRACAASNTSANMGF